MVYVKRVLKTPRNWLVHSMALLLQSRLEFESSKTVDKATIQLQVLVDQFDGVVERDYDVRTRMRYAHLLAYPPQHELKRELGRKWLKIGSVASALLLLEPLQMWDEVVECYMVQQRRQAAEELVRERLAREPTPRLWCLLGDLTRDEQCYRTAWALSHYQFTMAKRSLGTKAMAEQRFQEASQHFLDALEVNPQHGSAWFKLGVCALALRDYSLAQRGFVRCVQLYPDDGEAWNNLASVYIKLGKKREAFKALKEALKHQSERWQIWENLVVVALELGEFFDVINALTQLLELREKHVDVQVLRLLVRVVSDDLAQGRSQRGSLLHQSLDELLGKLTAKVSTNAELWALYAEYWRALGNMERATAYRQKQCRALQVADWEHSLSLLRPLVTACEALVADLFAFQDANALYSARLYVNSVLKKALVRCFARMHLLSSAERL